MARAQSFRIRGDWKVSDPVPAKYPRVGLGENPALFPLYFRALGETGARDELVLQFAGRASACGFADSRVDLSFRADAAPRLHRSNRRVRELLATGLRGLRKDAKDFWMATSERPPGSCHVAARGWSVCRQTTADALIRQEIAQRLAGGEQSGATASPHPCQRKDGRSI